MERLFNRLIDEEIPALSTKNTTIRNSTVPSVNLEEGWALFRPRVKVAFTFTQRSYLNQKYDEGEKYGAKWDAGKVAEHMQTAKKQGQFIFEPDQFLTASQIKSYFSRLTRERRKNVKKRQTTVDQCEVLLNNDEDLQAQEDEDDSDFNSAISDGQTYELLDNAIHVLDDILVQQDRN